MARGRKNQDSQLHRIWDLADELESAKCVLFVGAGMGQEAEPNLPTAAQLTFHLAKLLTRREEEAREISRRHRFGEVAEWYEKKHSWQDLYRAIESVLGVGKAKPGRAHELATKLPLACAVTTNYDKLLEEAFEKAGKPVEPILAPFSKQVTSGRVGLYKPHGSIEIDNPDILLITDEQLEGIYVSGSYFDTVLGDLIGRQRILFIGFGLRDADFQRIYHLTRFQLKRNPRHYAVFPGITVYEREYWNRRGIYVFDMTALAFLETLISFLEGIPPYEQSRERYVSLCGREPTRTEWGHALSEAGGDKSVAMYMLLVVERTKRQFRETGPHSHIER